MVKAEQTPDPLDATIRPIRDSLQELQQKGFQPLTYPTPEELDARDRKEEIVATYVAAKEILGREEVAEVAETNDLTEVDDKELQDLVIARRAAKAILERPIEGQYPGEH